jgi:hypothetical protein
MTRLPTDRDTHLTPGEITAEALRQFDNGEAEPSIRGLAASPATPSASCPASSSASALMPNRPAPRPTSLSTEKTRQAIGEAVALSAHGLRRLVVSLAEPD